MIATTTIIIIVLQSLISDILLFTTGSAKKNSEKINSRDHTTPVYAPVTCKKN
jgi:hypothetical protein